jgi:hypothetical protein
MTPIKLHPLFVERILDEVSLPAGQLQKAQNSNSFPRNIKQQTSCFRARFGNKQTRAPSFDKQAKRRSQRMHRRNSKLIVRE